MKGREVKEEGEKGLAVVPPIFKSCPAVTEIIYYHSGIHTTHISTLTVILRSDEISGHFFKSASGSGQNGTRYQISVPDSARSFLAVS